MLVPWRSSTYEYAANIEEALRALNNTRRGRRVVKLLRANKARFVYIRLVGSGAGLTLGNFIFLNPEMRNPDVIVKPDKAAVVAHEVTHFSQWLRQRKCRFGSLANERIGNAVDKMIEYELSKQEKQRLLQERDAITGRIPVTEEDEERLADIERKIEDIDRSMERLSKDCEDLICRGRKAAYEWLKKRWNGYRTFPERQPTYWRVRQWLPQVLFIMTGERIELYPPFKLRAALQLLYRKS